MSNIDETQESEHRHPYSENDDLGMRAIRFALNAKGVTFKHYRDRFASELELHNAMKHVTTDHMSFTKFQEYCKLLDLVPGIVLIDKKDAVSPIIDAPHLSVIVFEDVFVPSQINAVTTDAAESSFRDLLTPENEATLEILAPKLGLSWERIKGAPIEGWDTV